MTSAKIGVGLLYTKWDAVICKELKAELTNKCTDIEVRADVAVDTRGCLFFKSNSVQSKGNFNIQILPRE